MRSPLRKVALNSGEILFSAQVLQSRQSESSFRAWDVANQEKEKTITISLSTKIRSQWKRGSGAQKMEALVRNTMAAGLAWWASSMPGCRSLL